MRPVSMPKSQNCAHWQVNITARFSELRCKGTKVLGEFNVIKWILKSL